MATRRTGFNSRLAHGYLKGNIMGIVSEDGTVTGSIDVSQLDEIDPKSDEAKAQLDALKAERDAGQEQANADAEAKAKAEQERAQQAQSQDSSAEVPADTRDAQGVETGESKPADQPAQEAQPAEATGQPGQSESASQAAAGRRGRNQPQGG